MSVESYEEYEQKVVDGYNDWLTHGNLMKQNDDRRVRLILWRCILKIKDKYGKSVLRPS